MTMLSKRTFTVFGAMKDDSECEAACELIGEVLDEAQNLIEAMLNDRFGLGHKFKVEAHS